MAKFGEDVLKCSFCGKAQKQVRKLVAGPGVYICDECIGLCTEILSDEGIEPPALPSEVFMRVDVEITPNGVAWELHAEDAGTALERLPEIPRRVIDLRYGISSRQPRSLVHLSKILGLPTQELARIEQETMRNLKIGGPLLTYLEEARSRATISSAEEQELLEQARAGDVAATKRLIEGHMELAAHVAFGLKPSSLSLLLAAMEANKVLFKVVQDPSITNIASALPAAIEQHFAEHFPS